jgi:hypothetical protein
MKSSKLSEKDFVVKRIERHGEQFFPVYHPTNEPKQLLGYMRRLWIQLERCYHWQRPRHNL